MSAGPEACWKSNIELWWSDVLWGAASDLYELLSLCWPVWPVSPPDIDGCPPPVRPCPTPAGLRWWRKIVSRNIPSSPVCLPAPHGQHVLTWQSRHFPQSEIFLLSTILFNISHSHSDRKLISSRYRRNIRTNISIFEIFPFQKKTKHLVMQKCSRLNWLHVLVLCSRSQNN